jgi:hypothetical protein
MPMGWTIVLHLMAAFRAQMLVLSMNIIAHLSSILHLVPFSKEYAERFFEHGDPYTTMLIRTDPFVTATELMNETALSLTVSWLGRFNTIDVFSVRRMFLMDSIHTTLLGSNPLYSIIS